MSQEGNRCNRCGKYIPFGSNQHNCTSLLDFVYCDKCNQYISKSEIKDHLYCHSLENENNINLNNDNNPLTNDHYNNRNINLSNNNRLNNNPYGQSFTLSYNSNPGINRVQSFRQNNTNPYFDSVGFNNMMQNMNQQMQSMNTTMQGMNTNLNRMGQTINSNMNQQMRRLDNNLNNMSSNLSSMNTNIVIPNRNFNNVTQIQTNYGNNNSVSTSIVYDPANHVSIVTINRNGIVSTYRIRDSVNSNFQINQLINNGYLPNEELINSFPEREILQADLNATNEQKSCIICLAEFELRDKVITLPCLHIFHSNCIRTWLNTSEECPICKYNING